MQPDDRYHPKLISRRCSSDRYKEYPPKVSRLLLLAVGVVEHSPD